MAFIRHTVGSSLDKVASLFQPDSLACHQYYKTFCRKERLRSEERLFLAVLEDAISCFRKYIFAKDRKGKKLFHEAQAWLLAEDGEGCFSFQNTCEALGLSPGYIRQGLMRWKRRKLQGRARVKPSRLSIARRARASH